MISFLEIFLILSILLLFTIINSAEGHKFIDTSENNNNNKFENALLIPNHTVSWSIYQELGMGEGDAKFYKFQNEQINSTFYAQISIPKIEKYKTFTPSLALLEPQFKDNNTSLNKIHDDYVNYQNNNIILPFEVPQNYRILLKDDYTGPIPSPTFYEPFTQTSYWERQEINSKLDKLGTYYIVVYNSYDNSGKDIHGQNNFSNFGKFSLAVGKIEDFSILDLLVLIPYSWINVKLFFNDYWSLTLGLSIFVLLVIVTPLVLILRRKLN